MATPPTNTTSGSSQASSSGKPALPPGMVLGPDGKPCKICTAFRNWKPGTMSNTEADSNRDKQQSSRTPNASASGSGSKQKAGSGFSAGFTGFASLASGAGASTSASASSSTTTTTESKKEGEGERDDMSYRGDEIPPDCPPDVEVLGRSTWTFLHTAAAYFPDKPTPAQRASMISLLRSLPVIYPCGWCAQDFGKDLAQNPPDVSNGKKLSEWLCQRHNQVNKKLGKPLFDCLKVDERWKDGPADGRCD
ncbi:growth factor [Ephemerocybe angulata]|uniref:Sulfhydryl oxidase n=1 Tax=Ephemerocybe angulata TaxID=980116 RepID=A0A8H6IBR1_9AGAR|nr:growth factor [Tulosesus angulatus]